MALNWNLPAPFFLPEKEREYWSLLSFLVWTFLNLGGSFILHLPSLWARRVQIRRPLQPLDPDWYTKLKKPLWTPSNLFFPLAWIPAKLLKSVVNSLMWTCTGQRIYAVPVFLSITCIVVADLWNQVFFVQHDKVGSVVVIWMLVAMELSYFYFATVYIPGVSKLLYPLLCALIFASTLNTTICWTNRDSKLMKTPRTKVASSQ